VTFNLNSELYAAPSLAEGVDYARRHRRHERFDDTLARTDDVPKTTILAPHGGGIEPGTSELCLAVAGYHPASLPQIPAAGVTSDLRSLLWQMGTFGQAPMGWPAPNGYPDVAAAWNGASSTLNRWNFHMGLAGNWKLAAMKRPDVTTLVPSPLPSTYAALVDALAAKLLITLTTAQRDAICRFVDHAPGDALKAGAAAVTWRLPYIVALLLDSPNFATR
jgi:hypothetical protein